MATAFQAVQAQVENLCHRLAFAAASHLEAEELDEADGVLGVYSLPMVKLASLLE